MNRSENKRVPLAPLGYKRLFSPGYLKRYAASANGFDQMLNDILSMVVGLLFVAVFVAIYAGSAAWAVGDAQKRGHSGGLVVLLFWLLGPLSAVVWLAIRPKERLVERQPTEYRNADDAMDAATRLEGLGEWDDAVAVLTYTAEKWPKHAEYARQCIKAIDAKKALA